jgi:hypothetical protein
VNEKETAPKTRAQFLRDAFEGIKGRQPTSDDELNQWLATDEGKAATMFDDTTLSPWGERGRSYAPIPHAPSSLPAALIPRGPRGQRAL